MQNVIDPNAQEAERQREKQKSSPGYQQWLKNVMEANDKIQKKQLELKVVENEIFVDRKIEQAYIKADVARLKQGLDPKYEDKYQVGESYRNQYMGGQRRYMGTYKDRPSDKPVDLKLAPEQNFLPEESAEAKAFLDKVILDTIKKEGVSPEDKATSLKFLMEMQEDVKKHGGKVEALDKTGPLKPPQTPEQKGFIDIPARNGPKR